MANKTVALYRKCKTPEGWKRYPAVMSANGKVKPDTVLVGGIEVKYPVGHYELRSYNGSKTVWTRVRGDAPSDALNTLKTAQKKAHAVAAAKDADVPLVLDDKRVSLADARKKFIASAEARGAKEAAEVYQRTLDDFFTHCTKLYADQLHNDDVVAFHKAMRKSGLSDRTISNLHKSLRSFVLYLGFDSKKVKEICGTTPRYEEQAVEIFERDDLKPFFAALTTEYDQLLFDVLLTCGLREQEAMHLEWRSINRSAKTLRVQSNDRWGYKVKDYEQRDITLSQNLLKRLLVYGEQVPKHQLVFGKRGGTVDEPDGHLLRRLKRIVRNAGLNCGKCEGCEEGRVKSVRYKRNGVSRTMQVKVQPECEAWYLHKFRATYITTLHRNGLDLRTVMKLSGHSDLESVMRYLRPAEGREVQDKVNSIKWR